MEPQTSRLRPQYQRAPSRGSIATVASNTRSVSSSASQPPASPSRSATSQPSYRHYHITSGTSPKGSMRPTPQLSRETSLELQKQAPVSTFLYERLQSQRQAESERFGSSVSSQNNFASSMSMDMSRSNTRSPFKPNDAEGRPQSSAGHEGGKKRGMAVKEMEQVVSGLHKQNFDLKLELFHRREKQSKMEDRMEELEKEHADALETTTRLQTQLEQRDKAIEEAVAMIVNLEAKVDQLISERNMVKQIEADGIYGADVSYTPKPTIQEAPETDEQKQNRLNRMPSFLSERSATTENLRNVYLGVRGSVLSLRRISGGPSDAGIMSGLASPTLSVLSESSFLSVYGQKGGDTTVIPDFDEPLELRGFESPRKGGSGSSRSGISSPTKTSIPVGAEQSQGSTGTKPALVLNDGNQRTFKDMNVAAQHNDPDMSFRSSTNSRKSEAREVNKRSALPKVTTDGNGGVRLTEQAFPPTPDTIESATLQRMRTANEPVPAATEYAAKATVHQTQRQKQPETGSNLPQDGGSLRESLTAVRLPQVATYDPFAGAAIRRPQSAAAETSASHRRRQSWESDDSDTKSLQSSLDIWMRESTQPTTIGRGSPDLFGFPTSTTSGGWATQSLLARDNKHLAAALGAMPGTDYMHDLLSLREALFSPNLPPPPPNRRSSLNAATGELPEGIDWDARHNVDSPRRSRRKSDIISTADDRTPVKSRAVQGPASEKKTSHPPISWQQAPRGGINRLFRRSVDKNSIITTPEGSSYTIDSASVHQGSDSPANRSPAWITRSGVMDGDRSGSTPPPIQMQPRQKRSNSASATPRVHNYRDESAQKAVEEETAVPRRPQSVAHTAEGVAAGGRRKWLPGFGRQTKAN